MIDSVSVVLVRTIYASNIGSTSRAMTNMGFRRLILIDPQCEVNSKAQQAAAAGQEPMQQRIEYRSWDDFFATEGEGVRLALTRRAGKQRALNSIEEALRPHLLDGAGEKQLRHPLYLFFGPEDNGLSAEELQLMTDFCQIPTFGEMGSLNLAQAVLLALFIVRQTLGTPPYTPLADSPTEAAPFVYPDRLIRQWLESLGFDLSAQRVNAFNTLTRLLMRQAPLQNEMKVLESILQQTIRKLHHPPSEQI